MDELVILRLVEDLDGTADISGDGGTSETCLVPPQRFKATVPARSEELADLIGVWVLVVDACTFSILTVCR